VHTVYFLCWVKAFPLVATACAPHPFLRGHPATPPRPSSLRDSPPARAMRPASSFSPSWFRLRLRGCGTLGFALAFHHSHSWRAFHRLLAPADNPWVAALRLTLHSSPSLIPRSGLSVALPATFSSPMACPLARSWPTTAITVLVISCRTVAPLLALVLTIFDVTTAQLRSRLPSLVQLRAFVPQLLASAFGASRS
jgi:hypothetical protein